jgi:1,4-dihydroxy-2-naphthoyl-CoA hydrolase
METSTSALMHPDDWLLLCRTVRFGETDGAGVMHFHQLLRWCHEAYEDSLDRFGIQAAEVFPGRDGNDSPAVALPIVHCSADFLRPLRVGDPLAIRLSPVRLDPGCFEVGYQFASGGEPVAQGLTRHLAITTADRRRCSLPKPIARWLEASGLAGGVRPL